MDQQPVPLVDELASALNAAREELRRLHAVLTPQYEGKIGEPDLEIAVQADEAINRFELERDRTDLDAVTLPIKLIVTIENGAVSGLLTDSRQAIEIGIIDYDVPNTASWTGENMASIPQTTPEGSPPAPDAVAYGFLTLPGYNPARTLQLHRALYRAGCNGHNTTEH